MSLFPFARAPRRLLVCDLALVLGIAGVIATATFVGRGGRRVLPGRTVLRCSGLEEALPEWERLGVRGRVLVHFVRDIAMTPDAAAASPRGYVLSALERGVIRRAYHVVPDDAWPEVEAKLSALAGAERERSTFRLQKAGAPIIVSRLADLPSIDEPVIVTIQGDRWSEEAVGYIVALLRTRLRSDVIAWTATGSRRVAMLEGLTRDPT